MTRHYAGGMRELPYPNVVRSSTQSAVELGVTVFEAHESCRKAVFDWPVSGDELARLTRG